MSNQLQVSGAAKIRTIQGPVVANSGVITALDGDATQYVRGDGTLADFPTSTGGGSSVSYYLNTSVSQGTIGGVAYKQLSKVPISGAGTDVTISANGYVASYITDANDPALLEVPAGNFNCEFYFSVNSNAHNPYVYAEVYKYDGTTFTLLGSNVSIPQYLSNGTTLSPYYFAIAVSTAVLTVTDRIAIRIYVNVDTRTVTLHTENNHLCQVVTTFSKGLISLNNLTRQNQFFATGTSGTDFNISSTTATHTFNIPDASASARGLITTGTQTIGGAKTFSGGVTAISYYAQGNGTQGGYLYLKQGTTPYSTLTGSNSITSDSTKYIFFSDAGSSNGKIALFELGSLTNNTARTYTLPDASGTIALLESTQTFTNVNTFNTGINLRAGFYPVPNVNDTGLASSGSGLSILSKSGVTVYTNNLQFSNASNDYTFPAATGTLALTSDLSSYVPYTGATANVNLGTFDLTADVITGATGSFASSGGSDSFAINHSSGSGIALNITKGGNGEGLYINKTSGSGNAATIIGTLNATALVKSGGTSSQFLKADGSVDSSTYLPLSGGTLTGQLNSNSNINGANFFISSPTSQPATSASVGMSANTTSGYLDITGYIYGLRIIQSSTGAYGPIIATFENNGNITTIGGNTLEGVTNIKPNANYTITQNSVVPFTIVSSGALANSFYQIALKTGFGTSSPRTAASGTSRTIDIVGGIYFGNSGAESCCINNDDSMIFNIDANNDATGDNFFRFATNTTGEAGGTQLMKITDLGIVTINALGSGSVTATSGVLSAVSDMNLKIEDGYIDNALVKVLNLKPRYFLWKEESGLPTHIRQLGFYAQEVNEALGEEVANTPSENGNWGIYDRGIIAMLTAAIQEQQATITSLQDRLDKAGL